MPNAALPGCRCRNRAGSAPATDRSRESADRAAMPALRHIVLGQRQGGHGATPAQGAQVVQHPAVARPPVAAEKCDTPEPPPIAPQVAAHRAGHLTGPDRRPHDHRVVVARRPPAGLDGRGQAQQGLEQRPQEAQHTASAHAVDDLLDIGAAMLGDLFGQPAGVAAAGVVHQQDRPRVALQARHGGWWAGAHPCRLAAGEHRFGLHPHRIPLAMVSSGCLRRRHMAVPKPSPHCEPAGNTTSGVGAGRAVRSGDARVPRLGRHRAQCDRLQGGIGLARNGEAFPVEVPIWRTEALSDLGPGQCVAAQMLDQSRQPGLLAQLTTRLRSIIDLAPTGQLPRRAPASRRWRSCASSRSAGSSPTRPCRA